MSLWSDAARLAADARLRQQRITGATLEAAARSTLRRAQADRARARAARLTAVPVKYAADLDRRCALPSMGQRWLRDSLLRCA